MADIYVVLTEELLTDPLGRGYSSMTDTQRFASLTTVNRTKPRRASSLELLVWGGASGRLARVRKASEKQAPYEALPDEALAVAIAANAMIGRSDAGFDPSSAEHISMVDALVASGVLTSDDKTSLLALASQPCSRADELGIAMVGLGHLVSARQMME